MLFNAEFAKEIDRQIEEKKSVPGGTLPEALGLEIAQLPDTSLHRFKIENDDENQTLMWRSLLKDSAFYFDHPDINQEREMKKLLQRKYDQLFQPGWRPSLQSRRDLVTWSCNQYNSKLESQQAESTDLIDC